MPQHTGKVIGHGFALDAARPGFDTLGQLGRPLSPIDPSREHIAQALDGISPENFASPRFGQQVTGAAAIAAKHGDPLHECLVDDHTPAVETARQNEEVEVAKDPFRLYVRQNTGKCYVIRNPPMGRKPFPDGATFSLTHHYQPPIPIG